MFGERVDQRARDCSCTEAKDSSYDVTRSVKQEIFLTESRRIVEYLLYLLSPHQAFFNQAIGHRDRGYIDDIVPTRDNLVQFPRGRRTIEFPGCIYHALLEITEEHPGPGGGETDSVLRANRIGSASSSLRSICQRAISVP